ncbi:MAG: hypothetical protein ABI193_02825 [Minicystis sp.]
MPIVVHAPWALLLLLPALACTPDPPAVAPRCGAFGEPPCACAAARKRPSGACCPTWTAPNAAGECLFRRWYTAAPIDPMGPPGTVLGQILLDSNGAGIATWGAPGPGGVPTLEIGEELSPGLWVSRRPAAALQGRTAASTLATGPAGTAMLVWLSALADPGVFVSERDAQGLWKDPLPGQALSFPSGAVEPSISASPTGEWIATWCQATTTGWGTALARKSTFESPWQRPTGPEDVVSPPILFANAPLLSLDARGNVLVAWYQSNEGPLMTYLSERRGKEGAFSRPGAGDFLSPPGAPVASGKPENPMPALGPRGEAAVVWSQEDGAGQTSLYLATREPDGPWKKPVGLDDTFSRHAGITRGGVLAFGPTGELHVVWSQKDKEGEAVYAARRAPNGAWIDEGKRPVRLSSPGVIAYSPALAIGPDGGVVTAWMETTGTRSRVLARRTGSDRRTWTAIEPLSDEALGNAGGPMVAVGPGDRALSGFTQGPTAQTRVQVAELP